MIYFDAAYLVKCYLPERGFREVRALLYRHQFATCSALGRLEFATAIQRAVREGRLPESAIPTVYAQLARDENSGVWGWVPITGELLEKAERAVQSTRGKAPVRAADALHLVCVREPGCQPVDTNDRHMLLAAPHFGVQAIDVIS